MENRLEPGHLHRDPQPPAAGNVTRNWQDAFICPFCMRCTKGAGACKSFLSFGLMLHTKLDLFIQCQGTRTPIGLLDPLVCGS